MAVAAPIVELRDVGKTYANGTEALRHFDLAVGAGEFVSLLGPSGCGKSTVLRLVAGLAAASKGTIGWPREQGRGETRVGFVFQEPTLMPWATVPANVRMPLTLLRVPRGDADERAREAIE